MSNRVRAEVVGIVIFSLVALVATVMVLGTISSGSLGQTRTYTAVFGDIAGLKKGNDVRIAGVRVGKVTSLRLRGDRAAVTFVVQSEQKVSADSVASINFLNLMGQKYVGLSSPPGAAAERLPDGATIRRTQAPLDLTALFNAFKPVFQLIKPEEVNTLFTNVIATLQGEGPTIASLTKQTATLTSSLVERDEVIGRVIDNLAVVLDSVHANKATLNNMIGSLNQLTQGVARDRETLMSSFDVVHGLARQATTLLTESAPLVERNVASLNAFEGSFAQYQDQVIRGVKDAQGILDTYLKTLGLGSFLNVYVCKTFLTIVGIVQHADLSLSNQASPRCQ